METGHGSQRGSEWRRWDPHLHAPGTLLNDNFGQSWDPYLDRIEQADPPVSVLGVTDYFSIRTYQAARRLKAQGRMAGVDLLFPNVELRLDLKTEKVRPVNFHLLFSPDDPNHEQEIQRALAKLTCEFNERQWCCSHEDLIAIGRLLDSKQDDEAALRSGANQFKVQWTQIRELFRREAWVRNNCLVAVSGGYDGTPGLQHDDAFALLRREIERFSHVVFSGNPGQRAFWLGETSGHGRDVIEQQFGFLKPCLHGSDAHDVGRTLKPDLDRYCWIKGDPTFEALRQAVLEPSERVWIGPTPPIHHVPENAVTSMVISEAPWLATKSIPLNDGLVAVIGSRGSGKTALVEILARGAHAPTVGEGDSSFLKRATRPINLLGEAAVTLEWKGGEQGLAPLVSNSEEWDEPTEGDVCYLSQQFVDRLCSSAGLAKELRSEIERVVFNATDPTERLGTDSFDELLDKLLDPVRRRRDSLCEAMAATSQDIVNEEQLRDKLPQLRKEREECLKKIANDKKALTTLLPKGKEARAKALAELEQAHGNALGVVEALKRRKQSIDELANDVRHIRGSTEPRRLVEMRKRFATAELSDPDWGAFAMVFAGDVDKVITAARNAVDKAILVAIDGDPKAPVDPEKAPPSAWPLALLRARREVVKKEVGIDADQQKKYDALQKSIEQAEASLRKLAAEIARSEQADTRRKELIQTRRGLHSEVFGTINEEEAALARLYQPLREQLRDSTGALGRLEFFVHRRVDLDSWVRAGEQILDLRLQTQFRGHGALKRITEEKLLPTLSRGTAEEVASAMDVFRDEFAKDLRAAMPATVLPEQRGQWIQSMATWLYATDHVSVEYGIRYDGTMIEQLSPGTRGIVLLLLYLVIDQQDRRPLIVDQPEENLDPKSVFDELVPHFRDARRRRQVIVVTHNANLVVNTDADQVIVASAAAAQAESLPTITYDAGSLENPRIRKAVCETLEGGERAFLERERRYRLRWGESLALEEQPERPETRTA